MLAWEREQLQYSGGGAAELLRTREWQGHNCCAHLGGATSSRRVRHVQKPGHSMYTRADRRRKELA